MKQLLLTFTLFFSITSLAEKVTLTVPDMTCQMCVYGITKAFKDTVNDSKKDIVVDLDTKLVKLNFKRKLSDAEIKKRISKAGYSVKKIQRPSS